MKSNFNLIDLRSLRYLHVLCEERNVTKAAAVLDISQPSLSGSLAKLRQILGDPLFVRTPQGMDPTPCATELAKLYAQVCVRLDAISANATTFDPATSVRTFRVQANDYAIHKSMGRVVALLRQQAPGVSITIDYVPDMDFRARLESGEVDLNIGYMPDIDETLHRFSFLSIDICCIARRPHPQIDGQLSLESYVSAPHLCLSLGNGDLASFLDRSIDGALAELGFVRTRAAQVPAWLTMPAMVAQTDLIAAVPRDLALSAAQGLPIQILELPLPTKTINLSVVWHDRSDKDPAHRWFRGIFRQLIDIEETNS